MEADPDIPRRGAWPPAVWPWAAVFAGLLAGQAWMAFTLLSPERTWDALVDDRPLVSGYHPLHLYHGVLGAESLRRRGRPSCYDPAFQAGYPKTPVFDSGSRPAEAFLLLARCSHRPAVYKLGVAACICLAPLFLLVGAWASGLGAGACCVAVGVGLAVSWCRPGRALLEVGDLDLYVASLCAVAHLGLLVRLDRSPGAVVWAGLAATCALGWYAHPGLFLFLIPVTLAYYLGVGARHGLGWHSALLGSAAAALAANGFWLPDWARSWWIRRPLPLDAQFLEHRTFQTVWNSPLWGGPNERTAGLVLLTLAAAGVVVLNQTRRRTPARVWGLAAGGFFALAMAGLTWQPLGRMGTSQLLLPALWFAVPPAVHGLEHLGRAVCPSAETVAWAAVGVLVALGAGAVLGAWPRGDWKAWLGGTRPLEVGLGPERQALIQALIDHTGDDARILWEERSATRDSAHWTALLPLLTGRSFVGGLGPDLPIEHGACSMIDGRLDGRPVTELTDGELADVSQRYNLGWAVCWSSAATARLRHWAGARPVAALSDQGTGWLFRLPAHSYVLRGRARWAGADCRHIVLEDVTPEDGQVVLSLHYQAGLRALPGRVVVEREPDPHDPIPFIRLRMPGFVARVTLTWNDP